MIEGLKPYVEYKESDVPWFGMIPSHWSLKRLGSIFIERGETNERREVSYVLSLLKDRGVIPYAEKGRIGNKASEDIGRYNIVRPDDLVMNCMNVIIGSVGRSNFTGCLSPVYYVLVRRRQEENPRFLEHLFLHKPFHQSLVRIGNGILAHRMRIPMEKLKSEMLPLPPPDEQAAIVKFLDYANGKIERAIRAKRKLIGLLNEQKQAIIHRAVTRGLDPNVKLKPSGIPWLGDVPEHWEVIRFKQRVYFQEGPGIMAADFKDAGVPLLRISCLLSKTNGLFGCNYLDPRKVALKWSHFAIQPGDYILNASTSASTILMRKASEEMYGAIPYTGLIRLWPKSDMVDMGYLCLLFESRLLQDQFLLFRSGVGIAHFGPSHLKKLWVLLPPKSEQHFIISKLKAGTASLDHAISCTEHEIELLREYRTTLTAEVVTGKLDVREVVKRLPEEAVETLPPDDSVDQLIQDEIGEEIDA